MTEDTKIEEEKEQVQPPKQENKKPNSVKTVTTTKTIDFPSLGWGINEGEIRELPVEAEAQEIILANKYINIIK